MQQPLPQTIPELYIRLVRHLNSIERKEDDLMKIRIEADTLVALIGIAETAIQGKAVSDAQVATLQAVVANEEEMPDDLGARIAALPPNPPPPPTGG